ncbi:hypothetical protein FC19_GL000970 [Liquorilactobacillus aquaticus DSM 21051]|uniref:Integral membrane protein n=1 Tax=Liquorilactobacillus aquaticus DSM 21051 TaxID=1423725 RepID=A0A0R2CYF2_9LACO|nr:hypothetical protein [Liquorilactobacillus aquaticus]KRM96672.1 hypothetical protein FC19_GL000970 [Liquorilactobacillus aquaticus DSM 21051]
MTWLEIIAVGSLGVLIVYNLKTSLAVKKLRSKMNVAKAEKIAVTDDQELLGVAADKKRWLLLGQILFWISVAMAFFASLIEVVYFLDLYTITSIYVNYLDKKVIKTINKA